MQIRQSAGKEENGDCSHCGRLACESGWSIPCFSPIKEAADERGPSPTDAQYATMTKIQRGPSALRRKTKDEKNRKVGKS
jgi:hypothetical protein